jgi:hypothetical protein
MCVAASRNSFGLNINEDVVRGAADVMASDLLPSGYEYLLIDDGWPPETAHYKHAGPARLPDGTIPVSAKKFPSGTWSDGSSSLAITSISSLALAWNAQASRI